MNTHLELNNGKLHVNEYTNTMVQIVSSNVSFSTVIPNKVKIVNTT